MKNYSKIKEKCDQDYHKPKDDNFLVREFDKIKWSNFRIRNFFMIIKILAEKGYCTINEIIDNDGLAQTQKDRKKRNGVYNILLKGKKGHFQGLIDKGIIEEDEDWEIKRKKRYRLSIFGILYAIHLFSRDQNYMGYDKQIKYKIKSTTKYKENILEVLVENYSDLVPLIFGNWEFLVSEFGGRVNFLVGFAHLEKELEELLHTETFINSDIVNMQGWKITSSSPASELSILLIAYIAIQDSQYPIKFAKDKKILDLYKRYIKFLKKRQYYESLRVKYQEAILYGKNDEASKIGLELIKPR